jgi:hypothetical protein
MKNRFTYISKICALLCIVWMSMCLPTFATKKKTNWDKNFKSVEKAPYGMYVHQQMLKQLFPNANIKTDKKIFKFKNTYQEEPVLKGRTLKVMVAKKLGLNWVEQEKLLSFLENGNDVMMVAEKIDEEWLKKFSYASNNLYDTSILHKVEFDDKEMVEFVDEQYFISRQNDKMQDSFVYKKSLLMDNYFTKITFADQTAEAVVKATAVEANPTENVEHGAEETAYVPDENNYGFLSESSYFKQVILYNQYGEAIGLCIRYGKGKLIMMCEPLLLSNYNLLQKSNKKLVENLYSYFTDSIKNIQLHEYANRTVENENNQGTKNPLSGLMKYPMWQAAILLSILGVLLYVIFNSKRRQREVPIIPPVINTSVEFAETIGQLYYNKLDHKNIAEKMIAHFLEKIRTIFNIVTNRLDGDFCIRLSKKTGATLEEVQELLKQIDVVKQSDSISESTLVNLYKHIQQFNKYIP